MIGNVFTFCKCRDSRKTFGIYFDDLMFYYKDEIRVVTDSSDSNFKYKDFFKFYFKFDRDALRFFTYDHVTSIARHIRAYMKDKNCDRLPIYEVIEFLEKDVIVYIFQHGLYNHIGRPYPKIQFEREFGNDKKDTFDFISISFDMVRAGRSSKEMIAWVNENKKHMYRLIISSIEYQLKNRFGLSVNYLKVDDCILTNDFRLIYKLSLKDM